MSDPTPRVGDTITTVEQLDALPRSTVMRQKNGQLCETGTIAGKPCVWSEGWLSHTDAIKHLAPLTVLHVPGEQPRTAAVEDAARAIFRAMADSMETTREQTWETTSEHVRKCCLRDAQAVADAGLLAQQRTTPTREEIAEALYIKTAMSIASHDEAVRAWAELDPDLREKWCATADVVLALLADQPAVAQAQADALEEAAAHLLQVVSISPLEQRSVHAAWLQGRAARLRAGGAS